MDTINIRGPLPFQSRVGGSATRLGLPMAKEREQRTDVKRRIHRLHTECGRNVAAFEKLPKTPFKQRSSKSPQLRINQPKAPSHVPFLYLVYTPYPVALAVVVVVWLLL